MRDKTISPELPLPTPKDPGPAGVASLSGYDHDTIIGRMVRSSTIDSQANETRIVDETTGGAKGQKLARFDLIPPVSLWALAEQFGRGAAKYGDRNWELGYAWSLNYGALLRHLMAFWSGENIDAETGAHHLDAVMWHATVLRNFVETHPEMDDRPCANGVG
jgi:hypothetical protein